MLMLMFFGGLLWWLNHQDKEKPEPPPVISVPSTDANTIREHSPDLSKKESEEISKSITKAKEKPPTYRYITSTQEEADKKAQEYAQAQKADKLIKKTEIKENIPEEKDNNTNISEENKSDGKIHNDYYAINLEKKHSVSMGMTYVDNQSYVTASYRNRDITYSALYGLNNHKAGVGISVTLAKW